MVPGPAITTTTRPAPPWTARPVPPAGGRTGGPGAVLSGGQRPALQLLVLGPVDGAAVEQLLRPGDLRRRVPVAGHALRRADLIGPVQLIAHGALRHARPAGDRVDEQP